MSQTFQELPKLHPTPIHRLRIVTSCALMGAVLCGSLTVLPFVASSISAVELQAAGAIAGGMVAAVAQALRA
jgi:hypothetical protein